VEGEKNNPSEAKEEEKNKEISIMDALGPIGAGNAGAPEPERERP
jgi:hypothetical protein